MIFVTVGGQMPFDRLIRAVDRWAGDRERHDVVAQIGPSDLQPEYIQWTHSLTRDLFIKEIQNADYLVAHAGWGTIITALENAKPIILFPRKADLLETRNDHQSATAQSFSHYPGIAVAFDEDELRHHLDNLEAIAAPKKIGPFASPELLAAVKDFIDAP
jgi:UDP-N-acetylglucosamine transferase subunit ALG13